MRRVWWSVVSLVFVLGMPCFLLAEQGQTIQQQAQIFSSSPVISQPQQTQLPVAQLEPVVVTATRTETPLKETTTSVTVVTAEDIGEQQAETVAEVLRTVPGLDVAQSGSRGTATSVFIRGAESYQTLVLIDGVEVNSPTLGSFDFSNLTTENIDRIEVLRGSGGTLYGSQAIGGVINIITKKGEGKPTASLLAEGGNGPTHREAFTFSGAHGIVGFSGAAAYIDTDGFRKFNDGYHNFSTNLRLDVTPIPQGTLRGFFRYTSAEVGLVNNKNYLGVLDPNARQLTDFILWKGEWEHTLADVFNYRVAGAYVKDNQRFFDEPDEFDPFGSGISRIPVKTVIGEFQGNYYWRHLSATTFGFEFEEKSADIQSNFGGFRSGYDKSRNNFAYYLQEHLRLLNEQLFLVGGFRVDDNEDFGTQVTPAWSLAYLIPRTGTKLKGGYTEGFRAPNFNELFFPNFGNPNLDPERSSEWNVGVEQSLWGQRFSLEVTYFTRRVKDLIEAVLIDPDTFTFQAQNLRRVDVQGVEVIPVLRLLPGLTLSGNFTFLDFDSTEPLFRRPSQQGSLTVNYQRRGLRGGDDLLNLNLTLQVVGDRDDVDPLQGVRTNPMYARTNLAVSYSFPLTFSPSVSLTIYGKIENLFDRNYQEVLGFRSPPLNYLAGMKVSF
jgi:vitamin B12 transporter